MNFPGDLKYSKDHTWLRKDGNTGTIGITEFAQSELGEIVYVELPSIGKKYNKNEVFGSVEAVKTTSDLFIPVSGEIVEINTSLKDDATLVNSDPFNKGWLIKIQLGNTSEVDSLLDAESYQKMVS